MERRIARSFMQRVKKLILKEEENRLFDVLREYQSSLDLPTFVAELKAIINEPAKICLFDEIRPLVPLNQQIAYDSLCPIIPSATKKLIRLENLENGSLGFSLRGGAEHGTGVYVTSISSSSEAYRKDMRVGDEVVSVNGFYIAQAIHEEIIELINDFQDIELQIRRVGMIPFRIKASDVVRWEYVPKEDIISSKYPIKIFVNMSATGGLGCRIASGPANYKGIYIQSVKPSSLAHEAGLEVGDQILSVNETSFIDVTHSQAVMALKTSQHLLLRVRKGVATTWIDKTNPKEAVSPADDTYAIPQLAFPQQHNILASSRYDTLAASNGMIDSTMHFTKESEHASQNEKQVPGEIDVEIFNGYEDVQLPYKPDYDSEPYLPDPPPDFLTDDVSPDDVHDSSPVNSNFTLYKNPELSVSNENVAALSDNEARKMFSSKEIGGRQIRKIRIKINGSLGIALEGGANSPLEGRILVSNTYTGCVYQQGGIHVGDEILMADNVKFTGLTLVQAENALDRIERKLSQTIIFIIAVAPPKSYDEEITYF
ncbi:harmonin isoform X2 [Octopus vulgaris]|uniref:Harmonin isoform X2 n=1 Tax=Octopus vulgaris TaxID=6645 RepID=A0AA36FIV6_OCTVU|nr:harmonin isoform X2 [Octopus vulgaris]